MGDAGGAALPGAILHSMGKGLGAFQCCPGANEGLAARQARLESLFMSDQMMEATVETLHPVGAQGCA